MGCCGDKQPCTGKKVYDVCVVYQGKILDWKLKEKDEQCHNIQEVVEDIVDYLEEVKNTEGLGNNCLTYPKNNKNIITQKQINETFESKICELLENTTTENNDLNFSKCHLDYGDLLIDKCNKPTNICEFYQFILDELKIRKNG